MTPVKQRCSKPGYMKARQTSQRHCTRHHFYSDPVRVAVAVVIAQTAKVGATIAGHVQFYLDFNESMILKVATAIWVVAARAQIIRMRNQSAKKEPKVRTAIRTTTAPRAIAPVEARPPQPRTTPGTPGVESNE